MLPLIFGIEVSTNNNLNKQAISYYSGEAWSEVSYSDLKVSSDEILSCLGNISDTGSYVLLYLNVTASYPLIVQTVIKAGLGFIYLDERHKDRISRVIDTLKIKYIFSNIVLSEREKYLLNFPMLEKMFNFFGENIGLWSTDVDCPLYCDQKFLYAIQTSGTTGLAKLIQVPHNCIYPNIKDLSEILQITNDDIILLLTPVTFDPSIIELFVALYNGSSMCILDQKVIENPQLIIDVLFKDPKVNVSVLQCTPSVLKRWSLTILRNIIFHESSSLRVVLLGGEGFPSTEEIMSWNISPHISVYNIYGITEVSCWASISKVWPSERVSNHIGDPLSETILKIIDSDENNEGELLVGSSTRICQIDDKIGEDIFKSDKEIFRATGDIFKEIDGKLYFIRRKDNVFKRWGIRVSLTDIEKVARRNKNIHDCSCVCVKLTDHYRVGLFVVQRNYDSLKSLRSLLKLNLPKASWPDSIKVLTSLPLNNNGKVCRATLKSLCKETIVLDKREYFDELWEQYTGDHSDGHDFTSAGGDSLTALQLFNELKFVYNDLPNTFLGFLLQKKSKEEVWNFINNGYEENVESENVKSEVIKLDNCSGVFLRPTDKLQQTNVVMTYLKGKIVANHSTNPLNQEQHSKQLKLSVSNKYYLDKCIDASPLGVKLANKLNLVIVGSHSGRIVVINLDSQELISSCVLPNRIESSACISLCGNFYYIGCYDGCVYCINTFSGTILWEHKTDDMIKSTPSVYEGSIIFGSYDRNLYCVDKDGNKQWRTLLMSPILTEAIVYGSNIFSGTLGSVAALDVVTGVLIWEIVSCPIFSTPVISLDKLVIADVKGKVHWLDTATGKEVDHFEAEDMIFSSLTKRFLNNHELIVFGCNDSNIYCLRNRKLFWKTTLDSKVVSTPFIQIDSGSPNFVACFSSKGTGYLLNYLNGNKIVEFSLDGEVFSSPIVMENKLIIGCRDNSVYIFKIKHDD